MPLSVVAINEKHNLGIFEAGISTRGEMQKKSSSLPRSAYQYRYCS
jgi:hypothetical protein